MANKRVLLICYYFPPLGLGGVGRPLNLYRHLPEFGWDCHVLTVKPVAYRAYEPELLEGLERSKIFRSGSRDPQRLMYLLGVRTIKPKRIASVQGASDRFFPDNKAGWVSPAVTLGRTLCENYRYDAILSTSPPMSSHVIGRKLHREFDIPWIADYRDFWSLYKAEDTFANPRKVAKARKLMDKIREEASALTAVNSSILEYVGDGTVIPNGYMVEYADAWKNIPTESEFVLGFLGHLSDRHEPAALLRVLRQWSDEALDEFSKVRLVQVGQVDEAWFRSLLEREGLALQADIHGIQPRKRTIELLAQAHVLYAGVTARQGKGLLPGKVSDLLASGRPLLVFAPPDGEVAAALQDTPSCRFDDDDTERAVTFVRDHYRGFMQGEYTYSALPEYSVPYSSVTLARRMAEVMDGLV
ncbi:MAG: hypothetical protein KKA42_13025 [candidate division Zixibacteria bacterium]|nr:hypothetical protein [candidate division Zixibacteria bacterium]